MWPQDSSLTQNMYNEIKGVGKRLKRSALRKMCYSTLDENQARMEMYYSTLDENQARMEMCYSTLDENQARMEMCYGCNSKMLLCFVCCFCRSSVYELQKCQRQNRDVSDFGAVSHLGSRVWIGRT
jgi:tRNA(Ile)-lysidine synthase TilS/MesJ